MTSARYTPVRRVGDPDDDNERAALRGELCMGAVRSPLLVDVPHATHQTSEALADRAAAALADAIAHRRPPVTTHFVDGALAEHEHHDPDQ